MKVTPIAGPSLGSVTSGPTVSADRREAAKQAYLGETPTRITPSDTPVDPQVERMDTRKKIKMRTNFSTERDEQDLANELPSATPDPVVETVVPEVTKPISPQLAEIAKQRRALQVKESEIKAREEALAAQGGNTLDLAKLKASPLSVLQEAGVTYEQLTEAILSDQNSNALDPQKLREQIKKELKEELNTEFTSRDTQAEQQVLSELKREATKLVASGDAYEMIRENRMESKVVDLIHKSWKQTGEVMDIEEAANLLETELLNDALKIAKLTKVQSKLAPAAQPAQPQGSRQQMRTLTNRDSAQAPISARARAIAAFRGQLK